MPGIGQRKLTGHRLGDTLSLAVISKVIPFDKIQDVLSRTNKHSQRIRLLPSHIVIYYIIAFGFYSESSSREVLRFLLDSIKHLLPKGQSIPVACKSGISQARSRIGDKPLRLLYDEIVKPIATSCTKGAFYKKWRLVACDGSTFDVADTKENEEAFGRPKGGRGKSAFPQIRFLSLLEVGTHVLFETVCGKYSNSENGLANELFTKLKPGMLVLADRLFHSYNLWSKASETGADLLWRMKKNAKLDILKELPDGSYLSKIYPSTTARRRDEEGIIVRVIDYEIDKREPAYRLITTILDSSIAPAEELASLYHQRWSIETAFDELKNHLRGKNIILKSKRPKLVIQEFYGLLLAHYAIRGLMHDAAVFAKLEPDRLSFVHSVRVLRRRMKAFSGFSP